MTRAERIEKIMTTALGGAARDMAGAPYEYELEQAFEYASAIVEFVDAKHPPVCFLEIDEAGNVVKKIPLPEGDA